MTHILAITPSCGISSTRQRWSIVKLVVRAGCLRWPSKLAISGGPHRSWSFEVAFTKNRVSQWWGLMELVVKVGCLRWSSKLVAKRGPYQSWSSKVVFIWIFVRGGLCESYCQIWLLKLAEWRWLSKYVARVRWW